MDIKHSNSSHFNKGVRCGSKYAIVDMYACHWLNVRYIVVTGETAVCLEAVKANPAYITSKQFNIQTHILENRRKIWLYTECSISEIISLRFLLFPISFSLCPNVKNLPAMAACVFEYESASAVNIMRH